MFTLKTVSMNEDLSQPVWLNAVSIRIGLGWALHKRTSPTMRILNLRMYEMSANLLAELNHIPGMITSGEYLPYRLGE